MLSKDRASTGRDDDKLGQNIEMLNKLNKQQEHSQNHFEAQRRMDNIARQTNEEYKQRAKEIEILGRVVAELKVWLDDSQAAIMTEDFESVRDNTSRRTRPSAPEIECDDDLQMQPRNAHQQLLTAEKAVRYIPILDGDDIGVEDFITEIRSMRSLCSEEELLLKAITVEKIIGKAAQSIRNIRIENYTDLFDALWQNVAA